MALEGSIRDFSLADIFQLIGIQRKTGILTLQRANEEVKVAFLNGMVVHADSKQRRLDDRLGTVLVKSGTLSEEQLQQVLEVQKNTLQKLGHILLAEGLLQPEELREALQIQITQIIYRLFRWKDGDYHFEQQPSVEYDQDNFRPMSAESILMEGMRMIDEWPIIERKITSFDMVFEKVALEGGQQPELAAETEGEAQDFDQVFGGEQEEKPDAEEASSDIKLSREAKLVYEQVDGQASVQDIIDRTLLSEFDICHSLFDLLNRNLIVPIERRPVEEEEGAPVEVKKPVAGPGLERLFYPLLLLALLAGLAASSHNPLNLLGWPARNSALQEQLWRNQASGKLQRLLAASEAYYLEHKRYATEADELVVVGLLSEQDLRDPWGGRLSLEQQAGQVVLSVALGPGPDAPRHSVSQPLPSH